LLFIHNFYYFHPLIANKIFRVTVPCYLRLQLICGTGNRHITETSLQCLSNNQHGLQRRGQDFDFKSLYLKWYTAKRLTEKFPEKSWTKLGVNKLLKNLLDTGTVDRWPVSSRLRSAHTEENVETVNDLVLSQEDKLQSQRTVREISRDTGINHQSSVFRIICKDLRLKCFKRCHGQELADVNCAARTKRVKLLLQNFPQSATDFVFFTDKKMFSVTSSNNRQKDRCTQNAICLHFLPYLQKI